MIKLCKVLLTNELLTVVDFDGTKVQISGKVEAKETYVKFDKGRYTFSTKEEFDKQNKHSSKKEKKVETVVEKDVLETK